jgi:hypothetical protein
MPPVACDDAAPGLMLELPCVTYMYPYVQDLWHQQGVERQRHQQGVQEGLTTLCSLLCAFC